MEKGISRKFDSPLEDFRESEGVEVTCGSEFEASVTRRGWAPLVFLVHSDLDGGRVTEIARTTRDRERVRTCGCS